MHIARRLLMIAGAVAAIVGLFWIGQGMGIIRWPTSSFMIDQYDWVVTGSVTAVAGLVAILVARRMRG
ncbi:hypothetical protein LK533_07165 [Sphingomonas sp. PL-96]|uniref:hypothetical protein n=1 Tax=Sphingomonas sp. PL-96 TaxID=2887201 RepID=UPI001E63FD19|nr:hypothetical protein [Sphingomonas sp. PL-96]MCC2976452.1 hypothetical protein [Sphingomonas sp. PL-96]